MPLPNTSERQQEYMAHRVRVQNAKSVVNSQPPSRAVSKPRREMSFTEMMNSVRTAIQRSSNSRTFTNKPASVTSTATSVTTSTVAATSSRTSPPTRGSKTSRIKSSNSDAFDGYERDKSAMLLYDCKSCGAFGCCCCCGGAGDGRHCMSSCVDMHQKFSQHSGGDISASDSLRPMGNHMPIYQRSGYFSGNTSTSAVVHSTQSSDAQLRNLQEKIKKSSQAPTAEQRAIYQHARLAMPLRSFWHRITRKEWNDDTRIPPKPRRPSHVLLRNSRKRCVQRKSCSEGSHSSELINHPSALACQDECKNSTIPLHVLKRYQDITVTNDESMLRRLLRPRVFFDLEVKGIRPLGRIVIQLFTEACPEVVLEFVRMCTTEKGERMSFTRLFPPMWLEGELALTDNKTLTAHNIEHDTNVLDHGCGAGVLSFPSRYVRGSKRRFLSFSISFKPLKVLNGKRIAFGRVKRGFWILDAVQDYGTNSGKPQREIIVTGCGICK
uniref:Peptidyl-prolyl cis-trans isomerase A n=1 Tax=Ceratitis capitata TaxID=7213 RepID=W8C0K2_CERCA